MKTFVTLLVCVCALLVYGSVEPLLGSRMRNHESFRMEERARQLRHRSQRMRDAAVHAAIERVADDRVADRAQVHADLMRAAGGDRHPQ